MAILGGTGCGGRAAAQAFRAAGHQVCTLARGLCGGPPPDVRCDRGHRRALQAALRCFGPEVLVDHVGYEPAEIQATLEDLPRSTRRYLFVSSAIVYGPARERPYREREAPRPHTPAARSKRQAEVAAAGFTDQAAGRRAICLRLGNIYGPGHAPLTLRGRDAGLIDRLRRGETLPVPEIDPPALQPWFSGDHGRLLVALATHPDPPPVLNAAGTERLSWAAALAAWAKAAGAPAPVLKATPEAALRALAPAEIRPFFPTLLRPPVLDTGRLQALGLVDPITPVATGFRRTLSR